MKNIRKNVLKGLLHNGKEIVIRGNSMLPLYNDKDIIKIKSAKPKAGDLGIIYYEKDKKYLIHRIIKIKKNYYYLKGDNAYRIEKVHKGNVIAIISLKLKSYFRRKYCIEAFKMGKYSKKTKYNMDRVIRNRHYLLSKKYLILMVGKNGWISIYIKKRW